MAGYTSYIQPNDISSAITTGCPIEVVPSGAPPH